MASLVITSYSIHYTKLYEVLGRNIDELSIDLFDASLHASVRAVVSGGLPYDLQTRRSPDGSTYELKFYALMDDPVVSSGHALMGRVHCILIIEDVSRRVAYEESYNFV